MTRPARALLLPLALALPLQGLCEAQTATGRSSASATVQIRLVIPAIVRVLDNQHPASLPLTAQRARQELEVLSTLPQGFCAALRLNTTGVRDWSIEASHPGVQVLRTGDGYRICAPRNGRYRVALEHRFEWDAPAALLPTARLPWPVQTDLSAL